VSVEDEAAADIDIVDIGPGISTAVVDAARTSGLRVGRRKARSFIVGEESMVGGGIELRRELYVTRIDIVSLSFSLSNRRKATRLKQKEPTISSSEEVTMKKKTTEII